MYLDYNKNGTYESGFDSIQAVTAADGSYSIVETGASYNLVATTTAATTDSSGADVGIITLQAPSGGGMITPMTTMIQQIITADPSKTAASAATSVAEAMGFTAADISAGFDPLTYDAYATGTKTATQIALDLKAEKTSASIMTVVKAFAAMGEGAGATAAESFKAAMTAVVQEVNVRIAADTTLDLTNTVDLTAIQVLATTTMASAKDVNGALLSAGTGSASFTTASADVNALAAIKNVNDEIKAVTDITATADAFSMGAELAKQVKASATQVEGGGTIATIDYASTDKIIQGVTNKAPTDLTLTVGSAAVTTTAVAENASTLVVGTIAAVDAGDAGTTFSGTGDARTVNTVTAVNTYTIATGLDGSYFEINSSTGVLSLKAQPDYETKSSYSVAVTTTDGGNKSYTETFIVSVTDVAEGGFGISSSTVTWVDYDPATTTDITNTYTTATSGGAISLGSGTAHLNVTNINNLVDGNALTVGKAPILKFTLDSVPTAAGTGTVTATITQGTDGTRSSAEDQISITLNVDYTGNGTVGTLSVPVQTATGTYTKSDGLPVEFTLANADIDAFSITAASAVTGMPASLNVKMAALYQAFESAGSLGSLTSVLTNNSTYNLKIDTTLPLSDATDTTVTSVSTNIHLMTSTPNDTFIDGAGVSNFVGTTAKDTFTLGGGADVLTLSSAAGMGSSTVAGADVVTDFGTADKFQLDSGSSTLLTFADLTFTQGTGTGGSYNGAATTDTIIYNGATILMVATATTATDFDATYFVADIA